MPQSPLSAATLNVLGTTKFPSGTNDDDSKAVPNQIINAAGDAAPLPTNLDDALAVNTAAGLQAALGITVASIVMPALCPALTTTQIAALAPCTLAAISVAAPGTGNGDVYDAMPILTTTQITALSTAQIASLTTTQVNALATTQIIGLTAGTVLSPLTKIDWPVKHALLVVPGTGQNIAVALKNK